ncbi:unnamed protein product, partial [Closterium sp. NIES-53]
TSLLLRTSGLLLLMRSAAAAKTKVAGVVEVAAVVVEVEAGVVVGAAMEVGGGSGGGGGGGTIGGSGGSGGSGGGSGGSGGRGGGGTGSFTLIKSALVVGLALVVSILGVASVSSSSSVGARPRLPSSFTCGRLHTQHRCFSRLDDAWRAEFGDDAEISRWAYLLKSRIAIFDLNFDVILSVMNLWSVSAEGDCYRCVPPDPCIAAAALGASESGTLPGTAPAEALYTFTLDSGASRCFFRDSTTLTPLPALVLVRLADPSRMRWSLLPLPVVARSSTVLPCLAVPSDSLSGLHLTSFSTNLVSTAALQDAMVTTTTPGGQRVSICTCTRTRRHLATFTRRPGSSLYTFTTEPSQVAASAQVSASGQVVASCSCRLLSHQTLLWHHRLGHPSLSRLRGMHSRLFVSGLPRSLPSLPPSPAPPCLPCVERRQRATPHSSFPPTTAPLQTLHMNVKGQVVDVLIPWIRTVRLQLRERFGQDLPVLRLHSDRGGEFSFTLLCDFCRGEGILQSLTLLDSPQQNGIAERRIGLVMETSPTLRWTGEVGDASVFRVCGSRAFVRDTSADKLSPRAIPCVFLGFVPGALTDSFTTHLAPCLPLSKRHGRAPSDVSQVDTLLGLAPVQVAVDSGAARGAVSGGVELGGAESEGAETGGAEPGGVATRGAEPGGAEPEGVEPGGATSEGAESGGEEPRGAASSGGSASASSRLSPQQLREWFVRRTCLWSGASGAGGVGVARAGGPGVTAGAGVTGGTATTGPGDVRTRGTGAAGTGGVEGAGVGAPTEPGAAGAGGAGAGGAGAGGAGAGGVGAAGVGAVDHGARGPGNTVRSRPYFVPLLQQVLGVPSSIDLTPPLLCPPPDQSQLSLQPASPLPAPSPYTEQSGGLTARREPASRPVSPVRTTRRVPRSRPPSVLGTHAMTLRPSSIRLRPSALWLPVLLATTHSSVYQPLALSSTFRRVHRAEWSVPKACGLPHVPDDVHSTRPRVPSQPPGTLRGSRQAPKVVLTGLADASWVDDSATQQSSQGYTFSLGSGSVSWRSTRSSSVLSSSREAEIYAGAMAA